jgi:molybdopterin converting factor subunit 1
MITVTLLYFAHYGELTGCREQTRTLPEGATVRDLVEGLQSEFPRLGDVLAYGRVAVNAEYADAGTALRTGDEIALMPPMSGG